MTPEAQRIAIAEECGWQACYPGTWPPQWKRKQDAFSKRVGELPEYPSDLNAMHEAEKALADEQYTVFEKRLAAICHNEADIRCSRMEESTTSATATQRAEAFLRTLNLWDDSK